MLDRLLLLLESATELHQSDVLELADALARDAELLADLLEGLGLATIEAEPGS